MGKRKGLLKIGRHIVILCVILFLAALVSGILFWSTQRKSFAHILRKANKALEKEYSDLKRDDEKLLELRKNLRAEAIKRCALLKKKWDLSAFENGYQVDRAISDAIEALQTDKIEDGVPRLVFAYLMPDANYMRVIWVESNFDTSSALFMDNDGRTTIEANIFQNHNLEKRFFFHYYRVCDAKTASISDLVRERDDRLYVLVKYVGKDKPVFGPALIPLDGIATFYIPKGEFTVRLQDEAGNNSNQLPVLTPTYEMLPKLPRTIKWVEK